MKTERVTLDELERLEKAATPGKWHQRHRRFVSLIPEGANGMGAEIAGNTIANVANPDDAALIAASRNALPDLLRIARAAQAFRSSARPPHAEQVALWDALDALNKLAGGAP
jgi:hypothetical protein